MSSINMRTRRTAARIGAVSLVAAGIVGAAVGPAAADSFEQGNNAPTVTVDEQSLTIQPSLSGGGDLQTLIVRASDVDGVEELETVEICLTFTGTTDCSSPNLQNAIKLTASNLSTSPAFAMSPSNSTLGAGAAAYQSEASMSHSQVVTEGSTKTLQFRFRPGAVMRQGTWSLASATATDLSDATGSAGGGETANATITVNHFSAVATTDRNVDFGAIATGQHSASDGVDDGEGISPGTIIANGATDITYQITSGFTNGMTVLTANDSTPEAPGSGEYGYQCTPGATYSGTPVTAKTATPVDVNEGVLTEGTSESGDADSDDIKASCRVWNGGTNTPATTNFTAVVTVATTAAAS